MRARRTTAEKGEDGRRRETVRQDDRVIELTPWTINQIGRSRDD